MAKVRQVLLKSYRDAQLVASGIRSVAGQDAYTASEGVIPSGVGSFADEGYVMTDAPMTIIRKAAKMHDVTVPAQRAIRTISARKPKENPSLVTFANPRQAVALLSKRAHALQYQHVDDGQWYQHKFKRGVCIELLSDGSVRLYRADGQSIWGDF